MKLSDQCRQLTCFDCRKLDPLHPLGPRLVSPEYSKTVKEVKTYPLLASERIFFLCWDFRGSSELYTTMYPSPEKFCYTFKFSSGTKTQIHTHDYIELAYVVKGTFTQKICDHNIIFHEGDFILIDKNCIHQDYLTDQDSIVLFFGIENSMFEEIMNENVTTQKIISFLQTALMKQKDLQQYIHFRPLNKAREKMEPCISLLISELYNADIASSHICKGLLLRIFRMLSISYEFSLSKEQKKTMNWVIFEEVCDYIEMHYQSIQTQELMDLFHFQKDYFNRLIKKKTGMTYSEYLQDIRLKKARQLLDETNLSVSDIAEQIGYHNKGYFYKIFTRKYGMTPAQYRKDAGTNKRTMAAISPETPFQ